MPRLRIAALALLAAPVLGCESAVTEPEPVGNLALTGTFEGSFRSVGETVTLDGYLTLELTELVTGEIFGGFTLEGMLDDGQFQQPIAGTGPLVGSVSLASVAPMSFTASPDFCPDQTVEFAGTYDRRTGALLVGGEIVILDGACSVQLTFPSTISMRR